MNASDPFESLLRDQVRRYPELTVQDLIKLVHQHVFGGGHLISDERESLERIRKEIAIVGQIGAVDQNSREYPDWSPDLHVDRFEPIGNGLVRMHLNGIDQDGIMPETINRMFILSVSAVQGSREAFAERVAALRGMLESGELDLIEGGDQNRQALDAFMAAYDFNRCPPISHSERFCKAYRPAYRIVSDRFQYYYTVFCRIDTMLGRQPTLRLAIDGPCASGKSSLGLLLQHVYNAALIQMDHFFLPLELRTEERHHETGGNVDYERFAREVAPALKTGTAFIYRTFDCGTMQLSETVSIPQRCLTVVEGSYSFHPKMQADYDLKVFLSIAPEMQLQRLRHRNPGLLERFTQQWIPQENRYFTKMCVREQADIVIGE